MGAPAGTPHRRVPILLLVDDDPSFLAEARQALEKNYELVFAENADQAMSILQSGGTKFNAALVDLELPLKDGFTLIAEMHRDFPQLPVVAISGTFQDLALDCATLVGASDALSKPAVASWKAAIDRVCRTSQAG